MNTIGGLNEAAQKGNVEKASEILARNPELINAQGKVSDLKSFYTTEPISTTFTLLIHYHEIFSPV